MAALAALPAGTADAEPEAPDLRLPGGPPIQLDGKVLPSEWEGALEVPVGTLGARMRLRQCRGTLLVGFTTPVPWILRSNVTLHACLDSPQAGWNAPGFVRVNYEPFEHDRTHLIVSRNEGGRAVRLVDRAVARHTLGEGGGAFELACPLALFGIRDDESPSLRLSLLWTRAGTRASATWPEGLDLATQTGPGQPPPDLAGAGRWARLSGWRGAAGPGAFPPSDVKTWLAHDREIARRGAEAHAAVRGILEEPKKTRKRDSEQAPAVVGNFEWIAQHEPLTSTDLLALANGLRWLNRKEHALGLLDALVQDARGRATQQALYYRALTYEAMQGYPSAARDWDALADRVGAPRDAAFRRRAQEARDLGERWLAEQEARRADQARGDLPLVALHTNRGLILVELYAQDVPEAVKHFLGLVESRFYDGTLFHRVIGDFVAQGGDPVSRDQGCDFAGRGTSPREIPIETNERHGFWRGAVGFARGMREANGSQFFILTSPRPDLGEYTCFGRVVSGLEHVDRIEHCDLLSKAEVLRR